MPPRPRSGHPNRGARTSAAPIVRAARARPIAASALWALRREAACTSALLLSPLEPCDKPTQMPPQVLTSKGKNLSGGRRKIVHRAPDAIGQGVTFVSHFASLQHPNGGQYDACRTSRGAFREAPHTGGED